MKLVKLGGSAITYKGGRPRYRRKAMDRLARELAPHRDALCLVHGGGSFGHPLAYAHGLHRGLDPGSAEGFARVHRSMRDLNGRVLDALQGQGVPAVSLPPLGLVTVRDGRVEDLALGPFREALAAGLVPVTFGDAVLDPVRGAAICSGDDLMLHLARGLRPALALFVADVDGVRDPDGRLLPEVAGRLPDIRWAETERDVTGGLRRKLEVMQRLAREAPCLLVNGLVPGRVGDALAGRAVRGTRVRPPSGADGGAQPYKDGPL